MFSFIYRFFKINTLNTEARRFLLRVILIYFSFIFLISFSSIFIFLQALQYLDKSQVAILLGIFLLTESISAFPSGAIGDSRSFKIVLSTSALFFFITYQLLVISKSFDQFVLVYISFGIATAFHLENFFNYIGNNYDYFVYEDVARTIYSEFLGKVIAIKFLVFALSVILGAFIATIYSKTSLFYSSSFFLIIVLFLIAIFFNDHRDYKNKKKDNPYNFIKIMTNSISSSWRNRTLRFFILGVVITGIAVVLWEQYFSLLLYSDIGKSDSYAGLLFASEIIITAILTGLLGIVVGKITRLKFWYFIALLFGYSVLYFGLSFFFNANPIPQLFNLNYLILYVVIFFILSIPFNFNYILYYRTILDLIPEEYRGSIISLILSLSSILGSLLLFISSGYLNKLTFTQDFFIVGIIGIIGSFIIILALINHNFKPQIKQPIGFFTAFLIKTNSSFQNVFFLNKDKHLDKYSTEINNIIKELTSIAMRKTQISNEEKEMIDVIITDVQAYFKMKAEYEKDKTIKKAEKKELLTIQKNNIIQHAYISLQNEKNSEDLTQIVEKLYEILTFI